MDKSIILSGLFIGKCILFSSSVRIYCLSFDKDRSPYPVISFINTIWLTVLFYQLIDMSAHMHDMLK
jgi:hypothetical protein